MVLALLTYDMGELFPSLLTTMLHVCLINPMGFKLIPFHSDRSMSHLDLEVTNQNEGLSTDSPLFAATTFRAPHCLPRSSCKTSHIIDWMINSPKIRESPAPT